MEMGEKSLEILKKYAKPCLTEIFEEVLVKSLEELVTNSETKFDDMALAALKQPLIDAVKAQIEKI